MSATSDSVVTSSTFTVTDDRGRPVEGIATCYSPCTTLTFTPLRKLAGRTTHSAAVTATGVGGTTEHGWTFTTGRRNGKLG